MNFSKIKKRKDGRYEYKYPIYQDGTVKYKSIYGKSRAQLQRKVEQFEQQFDRSRSPRLDWVVDQWLSSKRGQIRNTTYAQYENRISSTLNAFDGYRLADLTPMVLQRQLELWSRQEAHSTVQGRLVLLSQVCQYAVLQGWLESNPCQVVKVPKDRHPHQVEPPSPEELDRMLTYCKGQQDPLQGVLPPLLYYTGLRKSEALALTIGDIKGDTIHVCKSIGWAHNTPELRDFGKTDHADRIVPILDSLNPYLAKIKGKKNRLVFCNADGSPLTHSQQQYWWGVFQKRAGVSFTPHQLRHAFATLCYDAHLTPKDAQHLLGHAKESTTLDIYTAISGQRERDNADQLNNYVNGLKSS